MDALQFQQYHHHQLRVSPIFMTPISFSSNLRAATLCFPTTVSKYFCTSLPKSCTSNSGKIKTTNRVSADELKEQWLNSLTCPHLNNKRENQIVGSQWCIGIDPDVSGALAVLKTDDIGCSAQVYDSPNVKVLVGNRIRRRLDTKAMVQLIQSLNVPIGTTAYIEQSLPFPGDGKQGWWSGGFNNGLWIGTLVASGLCVVPVLSIRWKQEFKLSGNGKTKDDSRALACTLFPTLSSSLQRKKDHGRAEALLIAAYGKGVKLNTDSAFISESLINNDTNSNT